MDASLPPINDWRMWVYGGYSNPGNTMTAQQIEEVYGPAVEVSPYVRMTNAGHVVTMPEPLALAILDKMTGYRRSDKARTADDDKAERPLKTIEQVHAEQAMRFTAITNALRDMEREKRREELLKQWAALADKPFIPTNEFGVILLFGTVMNRVGWQLVDVKPNSYPDGVFMVDGRITLVEFEFASGNFIAHGHDARGADMVICWKNDKKLDLPVIDLSLYYSEVDKSWRTPALRDALQKACTAHTEALQSVA